MDDPFNLGKQIDAACDAKDEKTLAVLAQECRDKLEVATDEQRVILRYYEANSYAGIFAVRSTGTDYAWGWNQPENIAEILALRQAIKESAFGKVDAIFQYRIRTNLGNRLNNLGRPIAAIEQWNTVLKQNPNFAMALGNQARSISHYAGALYDPGHKPIMLGAARSGYDAALSQKAVWDEFEHSNFKPLFQDSRKEIDNFLKDCKFDDNFDLNQWSLGNSEKERHFRRWCLDEKLFLNPLNDVLKLSVAARDILHLPNHKYQIDEAPRFVEYYNILKQEFVSSRYRYFSAINQTNDRFVNRDISLYDLADGNIYGHHTEELKSSFRAAYAILDKIALFLNDYYSIGLNPKGVNFRNIWCEKPHGTTSYQLRQIFQGNQNWLLRGLYFLSKDLFEIEFNDVAEPDATQLSDLRNRAEHRFLNLQFYSQAMSGTELHGFVPLDAFIDNTLRMLRIAREALVYLSLAMHREEQIKEEGKDRNKIILPIESRQFDSNDFF